MCVGGVGMCGKVHNVSDICKAGKLVLSFCVKKVDKRVRPIVTPNIGVMPVSRLFINLEWRYCTVYNYEDGAFQNSMLQ